MGILNLEEQLAFYRAYHSNSKNVAIHIVFIPIILLTTFHLATNYALVPAAWLQSLPAGLSLYANYGVLMALIYSGFYILLDPFFGVMVTPGLVYASVYFSQLTHLPSSLGAKNYNNLAATLWVVSWLFQFIGHGVYEGRAPALLDNLAQALLLAPLFVVFEVADFLGFRKGVFERVDEIVKPKLEEFRQKKNK
ncbi:DUF962-domain-containing protein [Nadsonia fulvescens var. elongata DSM 6958]|uniref:DUF962-domain-containing protein n=1 Tax=Nadsonia fulvescens var. elongata DSM 6958 TaxID=857566 RepID=A0A1E3PCS6_9ASCO|nr:DUF962-domain-containing protein [Nadsonia fulvescens var. elongata DSM 6958]